MSTYLEYPKNKPISNEPTWHRAKLDNGKEVEACAWFGEWYCFAESYRVVGFYSEKLTLDLTRI